MSNSEFSDYTVDHLFLLIGENPLPNYVAAHLLLNPDGTIHLIHTTGTKPQADLLSKEFKKTQINFKSKSTSDSDSFAIRKDMLSELQPKGTLLPGKIGLNYTGGTKAMAVHAYAALASLNLPDSVFSYLNSRNLKMCIEYRNSVKEVSAALALEIPPTLETLLGLHNLCWRKNSPPIEHPQLSVAAGELVNLHSKFSDKGTKPATQIWRQWCDASFKAAKDDSGWWKEESQLPKKLSLEIAPKPKEPREIIRVPEPFQRILRETLQSATNTVVDLQLIQNQSQEFTGLEQVYQWLNGGWLEDYVLWQIEQLSKRKPAYQIREIKRSLRIPDPDKPWRKTDQFEFDIAFLRGYQLFAISCTTTSAHDYCKEKLFEAYVRAKQLGGDEARIALVCCYENSSDWLKQEINLLNPKGKGEEKYDPRVEVFGRADLIANKFVEKLERWVCRNSK